MTPKRSLWRTVAGICLLIATIVGCAALAANLANGAEDDARQKEQQQRERLLAQMRELAKQTQVRFQQGDRQPQLFASPVFRYDDQPRGFLDATMWLWTDNGRPVAFEKIEVMPDKWQYCFTSASEKLLAVKWGDDREYHSTAPGIDFVPIVDFPAAPAAGPARKSAARKLARDFSARIFEVYVDSSEEMRILPTPIFEYSDPQTKDFHGAVFSVAASGINPAALIVLEPRAADGRSVWHYAIARMTSCGVILKYRGNIVWQVEAHRAPPRDFPTWTFFYTPRRELTDDAAPTDSTQSTPKAATP